MNIARMIIGEAATDEMTNELVAKMREHIRDIPCLVDHSILVEEGGHMVGLSFPTHYCSFCGKMSLRRTTWVFSICTRLDMRLVRPSVFCGS